MSAVTVNEMRALEEAAMAAGTSEAELMEMAGSALGWAICRQFPHYRAAVAYLGKGHNAGDTLIALRVLKECCGWKIAVRAAFPRNDWAPLTQKQWAALEIDEPLDELPLAFSGADTLLIDGLLGIGAKGALREPLLGLAREMGEFRNRKGLTVVAVDLPSGVDPDCGEVFQGAVRADRTFMIGAAKVGLLKAEAANAVGSLALVRVEGLVGGADGVGIISPQTMDFGKAPRVFEFHKGKAGRVGILAGSSAFSGAALLASLGALRAGGGLVTLHSPTAACDAIRARLPLEAMLKPCDDPREMLKERFDAIVVGPGLGEMSDDFSEGLLELIRKTEVPMVIDADGLNLISRKGLKTDSRHVLTPHPGEFSRLAPELAELPRQQAARRFSENCESVLLLKGARTVVSVAGKPLRINSTGSPAMANGGQGDLLSGVIGALLATEMQAFDAAALGAWLCGHAAEISVSENGSPSTATDVAKYLGKARRAWEAAQR